MKIDKIEPELLNLLKESIKNYVNAWYEIPKDLDVNNITIKRIRYIKKFGTEDNFEEAFIIEFSKYKEILCRSEIGCDTAEFKQILNDEDNFPLRFSKVFVSNQTWYEYPVIYGTLNNTFDDLEDYQNGGIYQSKNYFDFKIKYDH